jgi:uncharacterized small protein (DUF1192 family)
MPGPEARSARTLDSLKEALCLLIGSLDRLREIEERDAILNSEIERMLGMLPAVRVGAAEITARSNREKLSWKCIEAIRRLTQTLRAEVTTLRDFDRA